jgi:hypothetical protein
MADFASIFGRLQGGEQHLYTEMCASSIRGTFLRLPWTWVAGDMPQ